MSSLKAHQVMAFINKPSKTNGIFLFYGPDNGLIYENSKNLVNYLDKNLVGGLSKITLEIDEILTDPSILEQEANSIPMFGGKPCIRVRGANKSLTPTIKLLAEQDLQAIIILEAGNLTLRDSLRAFIEKDKNSLTLPCYADNQQNLSSLIRQSFQKANISIDQNAISTLIGFLGNDREITRREIEKLTLYAMESKTINANEIMLICGDNSTLTIDNIVDNTGTGRVDLLDKNIKQAFAVNIEPQRMLISALNHFSMLRKLRAQMEIENRSAADILQSHKPRPHFSRKSALEQQLRLWSDQRLALASDRVYQAIAQSRKSATLEASITHRALMAISVAAARY